MPAFQYEALTASGQRTAGALDAADRGEALRKLARRGLQPSAVRMTDAASVEASAFEKSAPDRNRLAPLILKRAQVAQFTEELTDLLTAGLQLEQALQAMENRSSEMMRELAIRLRARVRDGGSFSSALAAVSPNFGELYINLAAAGEASGSLSSILGRQASYLRTMEALSGKMISAMVYPAFIVVSGVALSIVFISYLLPKLVGLIKNTGGQMPALASWLLAASDFLKGWWWAMLIFAILLALGGKIWLADEERRRSWHRVMLRLPVYGALLRTRFEVQFLETLGNLLTNGLPLHRALELVRRTAMNLHLRAQLAKVEAQVSEGAPLSRSLEKAQVVSPLVVDMVRVGEQTGDLAGALRKAAERFDRVLTQVIDRAAAALQPVIIVLMAVMVGTLAWMMISVVYATLGNLRRH